MIHFISLLTLLLLLVFICRMIMNDTIHHHVMVIYLELANLSKRILNILCTCIALQFYWFIYMLVNTFFKVKTVYES